MATIRSRWTKRGRVVLYLALQLLIVVAGLELGLRLLAPWLPDLRSLLYLPSAERRFAQARSLPELLDLSVLGFRPYQEVSGFVLNSRSLRTKEYSTRKPAGVFRVLALGDSFTFASGGLPHPDHWPTLLEERLREDRGQEVEVLRLGVPGTGPRFQLRLWQLEGATLEADLVVLGFFVGNDFVEEEALLASQGGARLRGWLVRNSSLFRLLRNSSRLLRGAEQTVFLPRPAEPGAQRAASEQGGFEVAAYRQRYDPHQPSLAEDFFLEVEAQNMALCRRRERQRFDALFAGVAPVLATLHREVTASGARFLVLLIPDEYQVEEELRQAIYQRGNGSAADYDLDLPQTRLRELFEAQGIEYLDLLPASRAAAAAAPIYRPRDTHWNRAGNLLAAEQLAAYLEQER